MKILIIGIGSPVPSFILRRIEALDKHGVNLIIVGDKSSKKQFKLHNSTLITQPGLGLGSLGLWIRLLGTALLNPYRFMRLLICFKYKGVYSGTLPSFTSLDVCTLRRDRLDPPTVAFHGQ